MSDVSKDAWVAAVTVTVDGAEAKAILVNAWIEATDGIPFREWLNRKLLMVKKVLRKSLVFF